MSIALTTTRMDADGNISCVAGDPFDLHLINIHDADTEDLIDFSDWDFSLKVFDGDKMIAEFDNDDVDKSIPGALKIFKTSENTDWSTGNFNHDWRMKKPGEEFKTWVNNGQFIIE